MSKRENTEPTTAQRITRRRTIGITAAAAGLALLSPYARSTTAAEIVTWHGTVLGAVATMKLHHPDQATAEQLIEQSIAEVRRLETIFSLYRADSALVALNRHGVLVAPPPELVELLALSQSISWLTSGTFDVTVQPLWNLYANHFSRQEADPDGPDATALADALARIDHNALLVDHDRIVFAKRGMQVTLNGIAQGYMTDRVVDLLRRAGVTQTLVDMGETRCIGMRPDGRPWDVGIADPAYPGHILAHVPVVNQAVATSGGYGFRFDPAGRFNHLFDPKTGRSAQAYQSVTVVAETATIADALSTAFSLMTIPDIERVRSSNVNRIHLVLADGTTIVR